MLTNVKSLASISGKKWFYGIVVFISLFIFLFPVEYVKISGALTGIFMSSILCVGIIAILLFGTAYSPATNSVSLLIKVIERSIKEAKIKSMEVDGNEFYQETVGDGICQPDNLPHTPNIVLIMVEGLSKNIMDDSRNIMPNLFEYSKKGISFNNYYNHTAATYRGIIGQLYSSHQYNNGDKNSLVSLQGVLQKNGYFTTFVNSEPSNNDFTDYLKSFDFDMLTNGEIYDRSLTDEETLGIIFDSLEHGIKTNIPQFVVAYTFGTHTTFDSEANKFGDGTNRLLNRFHNCDYQIGQFITKLSESGYDKDTVVIITTDHATTSADEDYIEAFFPEKDRYDIFCDTIPLVIWYQGIEASEIDAAGRNSLDLASTVLDYLDIDSSNFFLGTSLFCPIHNKTMETVFCVPDSQWYVKTENGNLRDLTKKEAEEYTAMLERYIAFTIKTDNPIP